ncbi:hypothetical protein MKX03_030241 [Papaver bracteatum]|nr:hypothetical protein MKX03_030241 [Papaver bracteatum]
MIEDPLPFQQSINCLLFIGHRNAKRDMHLMNGKVEDELGGIYGGQRVLA